MFTSGPVLTAFLIGAIAAITSGVIGVFSVLRTQSFAGHSLADIATTGGALGAAALFLYLGTQHTSRTGASFSILFGSIFVVAPDTVPAIVAAGLVALVTVAVLARRLLLTAIAPDLARAQGVNVRLTGIMFLAALAVVVSLSAVAIGAVLSTALLVGPAATALRVTRSPGKAIALSAGVGLAATWSGIALAYESYYWPPYGHGWPVSFFVVALVLAGYLLSYLRRPQAPLPPRSPHEGAECSPA